MINPFRRLYFSLMLKFLLFFAAALIVIFSSLSVLDSMAVRILVEHSEQIISTGRNIISFSEASGELVLGADYPDYFGIEVLKDNRVIYRRGPAIGGEQSYSQEEINSMISRHYRLMDSYDYIPEYVPFTGTDGMPYALVIKIPKDSKEAAMKSGVMLPQYLAGSEVELRVSRLIRNIMLTALAALLLILFLLSRMTWTSVIRPLNELKKGLNRINGDELDTVIDFRADSDFEMVRDAFNAMARRLYEQQEENRRLTESKKQFILDLSHDLRTPITTIRGYAEALSGGMVKSEEERQKYLNYIAGKSRVMTDLINRLFDYSKLESGENTLNMESLDIAACFRNVIINYYGELEQKKFSMDIRIPEKKVPMRCSRVEMERALGNIVSNQIRYNPEGTALVYELTENEQQIILRMEDFGIGIEDDVVEHIFDLMVRGDQSRHGVSGTGLGLAITKKTIELHGGKISVESTAGKGSCFIITLPKLYEN